MIPDKINNIYNSIINCEDNWKAIYMAAWGYSKCVLLPMKDTGLWEKEIQFGLPASKNRYHSYSPKGLYKILTSKDTEFTLGHLQTLFSLFEEYINEIIEYYLSVQNSAVWKFKNLEKLLRSDPPFEKLNLHLGKAEINELRLAKETRNCFIHNNSKVDQKWIEAYKTTKGNEPSYRLGDRFELMFEEIEDWHGLILNITRTIKHSVEKIKPKADS